MYFLSIICCLFFSHSKAQVGPQDSTQAVQHAEAACGKCLFGMKDNDCMLAVRINGKAYHVEGADSNGFGDAHKNDGFCNATWKAAINGRLEQNRFKVSSLKCCR